MNKQEINEKLKENGAWCTECHTGVTDRYVKIRKAMELVGQLDEPQKPVVPKFVADWFEDNKHALDLAIFTKIRELDGKRYPHETDFENWLDNAENNPIENLIRMIDGYEVEKDPLYEVIIGDLYLIKKFNNRNDFYFDTSRSLCAWEKSAYQLTEAEIKAIDERYWPFAVPVEEGLEQEEAE
ncbi:TPA: DUF1642 domain-containing protein [Enterococcus faecium]|uniref:DUF1642 domain-containing protein n=1 Tax=Enterococcus faecium TaxID=1352 RepID=UPI002542977E|nr:DUF1642 domain-containing protein [Enterococcus faecium]MDK4372403.1 DUF1642 domain-containing protein [Enterococcus faecium]